VAYFNQTRAARTLLRAWAEAMAFPPNHEAADDQVSHPRHPRRPGAPAPLVRHRASYSGLTQVLDELVNHGGWRDRASFGWLPESYLYLAGRHRALGVIPVLKHDRGQPVGRNSKGARTSPARLPPPARGEREEV